MNKKELVVKYRPLVSLACVVHNFRNVLRTKKKGQGNQTVAPCALLKKVRMDISGSNNTVRIGDFSVLKDASIHIHGNDNTVTIGPWCHLAGAEIWIEDSGNAVTIGEHTKIMGKTHLAAIEGTKITIGEECLFSSDVHLRTGDSHSVLDLQGRRINPSEDISIGDHVWIGTKVTCLKGAKVPDHSILGACALVAGKFEQPYCILAGVPAKTVKQGVNWDIKRLPMTGEEA